MPDQTTPTTSPGAEQFADELRRLSRRLDELPPDPDGPVAALVQDLETAYEELRVADEEVRTQEEEIRRLVEGQQLSRWQQERMLSAIPVPAITTDAHGIIRSVNAAAVVYLRWRVARVLGKPVFALFAPNDRPALRRSMAAHAHDREGAGFSTTARVVSRGYSEVAVQVFTTGGLDAAATTWLLLVGPEDDSSPAPDETLPRALVELTAVAVRTDDVQELLNSAVRICARALGDGVALSINVGDPASPEALASSAKIAQDFDAVQIRLDEGPCADAFAGVEVVASDDVHADARWPRLAAQTPGQVRAAVAVPMSLGGERVGVFNAYLTTLGVDTHVAQSCDFLATTVAAALHEADVRAELARSAEEIRRALESRATIEQAKGIVMAKRGGTPDEAFAHLAHLSSTQHVKLRDLALRLVQHAGDGG